MNRAALFILSVLTFFTFLAGCGNNEGKVSTPANDAGRGGLSKLQAIDGKRICVLSGSAGDVAARQHFPRSSFQVVNASADAALAIMAHKADAFVYDKSVLLNLAEKNPKLVILDEPVDKLGVAVAIKKENGALLAEINGVLGELKEEGTLRRLRAKWVDSRYTVTPELPPVRNTGGKGELRVGTCATIEPFSFQSNGAFTGLDIELSRMIGERLGRKIRILDMNFEALIPALQSGKIDIALANFNVTEERKKLISFSMPYIENDISALVRRDSVSGSVGGVKTGSNGLKLASAADLKHRKIGVQFGTAHDTYATRSFPDATICQYRSYSDLVMAVKSGKIDAALMDAEPLRIIMRQDDSLGVLGKPLLYSDVAIGFGKENENLRKRFNTFLSGIRRNGVYDDMINRWMKRGETDMPKIAAPKAGGDLVIGVCNAGFPFTAVKDNRLVGFDIELAERFASYLGKKARFEDTEFSGLIAALASGKIDMIACSLYVTEERKKQISFSDPYYQMGTDVFALKKNLAAYDSVSVKGGGSGGSVSSFFRSLTNSFQSNIIQENRYLLIWDGLKTTVVISVFSTLFGTLLGAIVCFMRMSKQAILDIPARIYISILRGTPVLVLLMLIFYVVFASVSIDPVIVAVIAFGMNFAAYVAEIFRTGIEGVDRGQTEAGIAMGFTRSATFLNIVLPQMVRRILPVYKGEFISLVKMTSIVGYIAVQDLTKASDIIRSRTFDAFFPLVMVAILYFLISWLLMQFLGYLERRTDPKSKRRKAARA